MGVDVIASLGVGGEQTVIVDTGVISLATTNLLFDNVVAIADGNCPHTDPGFVYLTKITINGEGVDPFL
jgi:hypothetical protein